jgi:cell division protease FtsH
MEFLARQTPGFSGADIANVCNEAALIAARNDKNYVEKQDFLDAVDRIVGGLERKNKIITQQEKRTIAYHEAGHATVSWMLEHAHPLLKVTIIPRGRALGAAWYQPEERQITTVEQLFEEMCSTLGGRASEELTFGTISTGALNDLERVTKQAYAMISYYGMGSELGNLSFYDSSGNTDYSFTKPYSENTSEAIDREVFELVDKAYRHAKDTLIKHKEGLVQLAELLLEKEVIFSEDLERIFGKRKFKKEGEEETEKDSNKKGEEEVIKDSE